jgi:hypothetical protein
MVSLEKNRKAIQMLRLKTMRALGERPTQLTKRKALPDKTSMTITTRRLKTVDFYRHMS